MNEMNFEPEWLLRILFSAIIRALIGYERHSRAKEAGVRTHSIVALASAMMMIVSKYGFTGEFDSARVAAQIITGISFLGAGIIFVRNDTIQGLTTAAGIWATAGIGMAIGAGMYIIGIFSGLLIIAIQTYFHHARYFTGSRAFMDIIVIAEENCSTERLVDRMEKMGLTVSDIRIKPNSVTDGTWQLSMEVSSLKGLEPQAMLMEIEKIDGVDSVIAA